MVLLCRFSIRKSSSQNVGQSRAFTGELISLLQKISLSRKRCFGVFKEQIRLLQELPPSSQMAPPKKVRFSRKFSNFNNIDLHCSKTFSIKFFVRFVDRKWKRMTGPKSRTRWQFMMQLRSQFKMTFHVLHLTNFHFRLSGVMMTTKNTRKRWTTLENWSWFINRHFLCLNRINAISDWSECHQKRWKGELSMQFDFQRKTWIFRCFERSVNISDKWEAHRWRTRQFCEFIPSSGRLNHFPSNVAQIIGKKFFGFLFQNNSDSDDTSLVCLKNLFVHMFSKQWFCKV